MSDPVLEKELAAAGMVKLGGAEYRLSYPMKAVILYKQMTAKLDRQRDPESKSAGDSLFNLASWPKLNPADDPERFLMCLCAGLSTTHPEMVMEKLELLIDFANVKDVEQAIVETLKSYFPAPAEGDSPNPAPAETPAA